MNFQIFFKFLLHVSEAQLCGMQSMILVCQFYLSVHLLVHTALLSNDRTDCHGVTTMQSVLCGSLGTLAFRCQQSWWNSSGITRNL